MPQVIEFITQRYFGCDRKSNNFRGGAQCRLQDLYFYIRFRDQNPGARAKAIGEQYAPIEEPLRKVIKAYSILAYPHIQDWWLQDQIETDLESDRQAYGRDDVELSDMELRALGRLAATRNLPFDPEKRRYEYGEVQTSP